MKYEERSDLDYHQLLDYMKELKAFFYKAYSTQFKLGNIYQGNPAYSYFSLTTEELKKQKLKFVIILNHKTLSFSICLSGQNKSVRKKYWELLKQIEQHNYSLAASIDDRLSIIEQTIVKEPDFSNREKLTKKIEKEALKFIDEVKSLLE